ncbi:putative inorganic phosphate cotransporter isoform X2 [Penaeus japonicus]|nr:putative inorganic phosphate cotransporter isoform X2 [Penaeus japonicus]
MGFLGLGVLYAMRVCLSVAIVAMVKADVKGLSITGNRSIEVCPIPEEAQEKEFAGSQDGEFSWDKQTQGVVLGSFFYGSLFSNFLGGRLAEYQGGKLVLGMGILLSSLFSLLSPLCVRFSTVLFAVVRVLQGATLGVGIPAMNVLLATWIPPIERSKFSTFVFNGLDFGIVITMMLSGWLCETGVLGGWPLVFYVYGGLGLLWSVAWFLLVSDFPQTHPRISQEERSYIVRQCDLRRGQAVPIPWRSILTSLPVWSIIIVHFGNNWGSFTFLAELPSYFKNIHHFDIKSNGLLSALPFLTLWIFSVVYSTAMDKLLSSRRLSIIAVRKISMAIASLGRALGLLALCFVGCDSVAAIAAICVSVGFGGSVYCGFMCSHQDLAPNLAGTLMGLSITIGTIPGFVAPLITGFIVSGNQTLASWRTVFLISASVYLITGLIYILFITAEQQPWNDVQKNTDLADKDKKEEESPFPKVVISQTQEKKGTRLMPEGYFVASFPPPRLAVEEDPEYVMTRV